MLLARKKENRQTKRGMGGGQGPHLHEQEGSFLEGRLGEREWGAVTERMGFGQATQGDLGRLRIGAASGARTGVARHM